MSLKDCRARVLEAMLDLIWSQWIALGVSGNAPMASKWVIDPEALVVFTCSIGRYDARVFDGMLEWLGIHQRLLNVQRLKNLNRREGSSGGDLTAGIANLLMKPASRSKWKRAANLTPNGEVKEEPLFYLKDGRPHPRPTRSDPAFEKAGFSRQVYKGRNIASQFQPEHPANLIMKLRTLFGVNARSEIIAYLATHSAANPTETAAAIGYSQKAVHNVMTELFQSGTLAKRVKGRETLYSLREKQWHPLLGPGVNEISWLDWSEAFSFLEAVWAVLDSKQSGDKEDHAAASELALLVLREMPDLPQPLCEPLEDALRGKNLPGVQVLCDALMEFIELLNE